MHPNHESYIIYHCHNNFTAITLKQFKYNLGEHIYKTHLQQIVGTTRLLRVKCFAKIVLYVMPSCTVHLMS